ncbi:MAG: tripartite tricarboxylate transporter substrate binding protein [Acetobacteraceae bacterium]|nr:tripartite tricarboxylate transporter substrate binding protein [Acetobacteraceae bacterium]
MSLTRRAVWALPLALPLAAQAQDWPTRPVRLVVPYPPGGPTDIAGRVTALGLPAELGQPVIVDNRPGASGNIGAGEVARAAPDGSVFLVNASAHVIVPHLNRNMPFDALADFAPVTEICKVPLIVVVPAASPIRSIADLAAAARAGAVTYASSSIGGAPHLAGELFKLMTGTDMTHVPYRGSGPALQDLIAGNVQVMFDSLASSAGHVREGRLRALAVTTAARLPAFPDLPTVAEAGVAGYEITTWYGMWAAARTPAAILNRMQQGVARAIRTDDARARFAAMGAEPIGSTPDAFARFAAEEFARFGRVVRDGNIQAE